MLELSPLLLAQQASSSSFSSSFYPLFARSRDPLSHLLVWHQSPALVRLPGWVSLTAVAIIFGKLPHQLRQPQELQ